MDLNTLVNVLSATNNNDNSIRGNAEKALGEVREWAPFDAIDDASPGILPLSSLHSRK